MALDFHQAMQARTDGFAASYDAGRAMLYALATGFGRDPLDPAELAFVDERALRVVPTFATVIAWGARDVRTLGVDYARVLHGAQRLRLHRPLPPAAAVRADAVTKSVHDKGIERGAVIVSTVEIRADATRELLCTLETTHVARGDGGFAATSGDSGPAPRPDPVPDRAADRIVEIRTEPHLALLYRLLGDRNRLHVDPAVARAAGFERPILHGLCTYGLCCHAVLRHALDYAVESVREFNVRFAAPLLPGQSLQMEIWLDGASVAFRARERDSGRVVVDNGLCRVER